jgi:hypothetical protein
MSDTQYLDSAETRWSRYIICVISLETQVGILQQVRKKEREKNPEQRPPGIPEVGLSGA